MRDEKRAQPALGGAGPAPRLDAEPGGAVGGSAGAEPGGAVGDSAGAVGGSADAELGADVFGGPLDYDAALRASKFAFALQTRAPLGGASGGAEPRREAAPAPIGVATLADVPALYDADGDAGARAARSWAAAVAYVRRLSGMADADPADVVGRLASHPPAAALVRRWLEA